MRFLRSGIVTAIIATTILLGLKGASYAASRYEVQSGTVSIYFYPFTLQIFESAGLTVAGSENTTLLPNSEVGFNILPPSDNHSLRGSNFTFDYDSNTRQFTPVTGAIETTGNFVFNNSATNLPLSGIKRLGNFTIGFDNNSSNLFLKDNLDAQVPIGKLDFVRFLSVVDNKLFINSDLIFSEEISDLLKSGGAINTSGYRGARVGIVASVIQVPEPSFILGIIGVSLSCIAYRKKNNVVAGALPRQLATVLVADGVEVGAVSTSAIVPVRKRRQILKAPGNKKMAPQSLVH
ncbi:hypothetical protein CAL7716_060190 [Calothrix sp. PCC 7716]|nr:hypothetical protein CAL7716_060190 [Calothrix sp. PCC 7716]